MEPHRKDANRDKKPEEKPLTKQDHNAHPIPLHKPETKHSEPAKNHEPTKRDEEYHKPTSQKETHHPPKDHSEHERKPEPHKENPHVRDPHPEVKNHPQPTSQSPHKHPQEHDHRPIHEEKTTPSKHLKAPISIGVLITDETDNYYPSHEHHEQPDNYESMKDVDPFIPNTDDLSNPKTDNGKIDDANPFRRSQEPHETIPKHTTKPKETTYYSPETSNQPKSLPNRTKPPGAQANYLNFLSNNAQSYVNSKTPHQVPENPEKYDMNKKLNDMKLPTMRESESEYRPQYKPVHKPNDYKKDFAFDLGETSYKRKPSMKENPLFESESLANPYIRRHGGSMEPPGYGTRRPENPHDDYLSKIRGFKEPPGQNPNRPPSSKMNSTYKHPFGENAPPPLQTQRRDRDKDFYNKQNDLNQIYNKLNEKHKAHDQQREPPEEYKKGNLNNIFPANKRLQEEKERIDKMLSEQHRKKQERDEMALKRVPEKNLEKPLYDDYIKRLKDHKPWLEDKFIAKLSFETLKADFPLQDDLSQLPEEYTPELKRELEFIKDFVDPIRNKPKEAKTDLELANDVRYYNRYAEYLVKRMQSKNYYGRLELNRESSHTEVRAAFRAKALLWHPDSIRKNYKHCFANEKQYTVTLTHVFGLIDEAYRTLSNKERRMMYNQLTRK